MKAGYLAEWNVVEHHLLALANAIPAESYDCRPVAGARSISEVFVHVAAENFLLLSLAGVACDMYTPSESFAGSLGVNIGLEKTMTAKAGVVDLLKRSLDAVRQAFIAATQAELERSTDVFGDQTTVYRLYMRMLAHSHEHMGQMVAYVRAMGMEAPWPDPVQEMGTAS